jgi:hypothetical protein
MAPRHSCVSEHSLGKGYSIVIAFDEERRDKIEIPESQYGDVKNLMSSKETSRVDSNV